MLFVFAVILSGCATAPGNGSSSKSNSNSSSSSNNSVTTNTTSAVVNQNYDIADAANLAVVPLNSALKLKSPGRKVKTSRFHFSDANNSSDSTLCKIDTNGNMSIVSSFSVVVVTNTVLSGTNVLSSFITTNLVTNTILNPDGIYVVNTNYLIVSFGYSEAYLVRKADGAVFSLNNVGSPSDEVSYYTGDIVNSDNSGNIYYITSFNSSIPSVLVKINTQDPNNLTATTYSASGDTVTSFTLDSSGNAAYQGEDSGKNSVMRFRYASGGFAILPGEPNYSFTCSWIGFDGLFYFYDGSLPYLQQMYVSNNVLTYTNWGGIAVEFNDGVQNLLKIPAKNHIIAFSSSGGSSIYDLYNPSNYAKTLDMSLFNLSAMKTEACSANYYYIVGTSGGQPVLLKIDPDDTTYTTYSTLINGNYDIYSLTVSTNDNVTFNALRMSDGCIVYGSIASNGTISIIDTNMNAQATILQRIN